MNARPLLRAIWNAPFALLVLANLFWSGNFIAGRAAAGLVPPVAFAFWRWTIALALVLALGFTHIRRDWPALVRSWPMLVVLAAFGIALYNTGTYVGLTSTTALNALLLQSSMPLMILAAGLLLFGERPRARQLAGVAVSLGGVAAISCKGDWTTLSSLQFGAGDLWIMAAIGAYALYSALLRKRPAVHPLSFLAATFALGAIMLLPVYLHEHLTHAAVQPVAISFAAIGYVAVFPGFLAYLFYNRGVELAGASAAGHFMHLMPIFGSALAIALLGESLAGFHVLGAALIVIGLVAASTARA